MINLLTCNIIDNNVKNAVLIIGNFDGVHLGHINLIKQAKMIADKRNVALVAMIFSPHPRSFFNKDSANIVLTQIDDRIKLLKDNQVDQVIVNEFNQDFADLTPEKFVKNILVDKLNIAELVIGSNYHFGAKRVGNKDVMIDLSNKYNFAVSIIDLQEVKASSTVIRNYLSNGKIKDISNILGRNWYIRGLVEHGDGRGRELGFPTANLKLHNYQKLQYGVYAVKVIIENKYFYGVANFGTRPTFADKKELLEVHILDYSANIYNKNITVEFVDFIRQEKKFSNIDDLRLQINQDISKSQMILRDK